MAEAPTSEATSTDATNTPRGMVRLYLRLVSADVRSSAQYPLPFVLGTVTSMALLLLDLVAILAVFGRVDELAGWTLTDALVIYGLAQTTAALADLAVGHLDGLPQWIRTGRLDTLLLRPRPVLVQILATDVDVRSVGKVVQAAVILVVALVQAGIDWTPARVVLLVAALVAGVAIYAAVWLVGNSITFWLVDSREVSAAFTYGGRQFTSYPLGIYGEWLRHLFRLAVPLAFTAYYPALGLLGRDDPLGAPAWFSWLGSPAAVLSGVVAAVVWRTGLRSYRSVGA